MTGPDQKSAFAGSILGLALGDAMGAPLEGGPLERFLWRLLVLVSGTRFRWTDDTQMTLDVASSLTSRGGVDQDDLASRFAASYQWSRGYGPGAARVLKLIRRGVDWRTASTRVFQDGSFGNGGAMRAPVVGLFFASDLDRVAAEARSTALITHAHPLAQEGAVLIALGTALALSERTTETMVEVLQRYSLLAPFRERLDIVSSWLPLGLKAPIEVRKHLGNGMAAADSCITALYIALRFLNLPFCEMIHYAAACRGDVDTIGAMAGAIWGARNQDSSLPQEALERLEKVELLREVASELYAAARAT